MERGRSIAPAIAVVAVLPSPYMPTGVLLACPVVGWAVDLIAATLPIITLVVVLLRGVDGRIIWLLIGIWRLAITIIRLVIAKGNLDVGVRGGNAWYRETCGADQYRND
jgi:hypothetical protein